MRSRTTAHHRAAGARRDHAPAGAELRPRPEHLYSNSGVGGQAMLDALHTTGTLNDATSLTYALGLTIGQFRSLETVSHGGSWAGYRAELVRSPEHRLSVATRCNVASANPSALARDVAAVYLEDRLAPAAQPVQPAPASADTTRVAVPAEELQPWAGMYVNPTTGMVRMVTLEDVKLFATFGQARRELLPRSAHEFTAVVGAATLRLTFERTPADAARRMRQFTNGRETAGFVEVLNPSTEALQSYAGSYYSEELIATYTLTVDSGVLQVRGPTASPISLRALPDHTFSAGGVMLRFARDAQGRSTAFELSQGRVRGIQFRRTQPHRPSFPIPSRTAPLPTAPRRDIVLNVRFNRLCARRTP